MRDTYRLIDSAAAYARAYPHAAGGMQYEGEGLYNKRTGYRMDEGQRGDEICAPMVFGDYQDYRSPVDGKVISGRRQRRYDLESNGCIEKDSREAMARHRGVSTKYAPTYHQTARKRDKIEASHLDDRVLHDKLRAVANGARGI